MRGQRSALASRVARWLSPTVLVTLAALTLFAAPRSAAEPAPGAIERWTGAGPQAPGPQPRVIRELKEARTATSRTYMTEDGAAVAKVFPVPVNYRATGGRYEPIDNALVPATGAAGGWRNRANAYLAQLPQRLSRPVRIEVGDEWLEFRLEGGRGMGTARGHTATYADALESVDVSYAATNVGLKETLRLTSNAAPAAFRFEVETSQGTRLRENGAGGVDLLEGDRIVGAFAAPFAFDSAAEPANAPHVELRLIEESGRPMLELAVDSDWLRSPSRRFPVYIDPTFEYQELWAKVSGPTRDTYVQESEPTINHGSLPVLRAGRTPPDRVHPGRQLRSFLLFDVARAIPEESMVFSATLGAYLQSKTTTAPAELDLHLPTRSWSTAATWMTTNGSTPWTTPGGDVGGAIGEPVSPAAGWNHWKDLGKIVQAWADGSRDNHGVVIDEAAGSPDNVHSFTSVNGPEEQWPFLQIWYTMRSGTSSDYSFWRPDGTVAPGADSSWEVPPGCRPSASTSPRGTCSCEPAIAPRRRGPPGSGSNAGTTAFGGTRTSSAGAGPARRSASSASTSTRMARSRSTGHR